MNTLSKEELEILVILSEECAEVSQVVSKIIRNGIHNIPSGKKTSNAVRLGEELGDILGVISILQKVIPIDELSTEQLEINRINKLERIKNYLHHISAESINKIK